MRHEGKQELCRASTPLCAGDGCRRDRDVFGRTSRQLRAPTPDGGIPALTFLLLISVTLIADGYDQDIPQATFTSPFPS